MAIKTHCDNCDREFSAQDDYVGKKIRCPGCGSKVDVLAEEDRRERELRQREEDDWRREQQGRIELIESMEKRKADSFARNLGTGVDRVRNFNPGAVSRFRKLRALSNFMILSAYLVGGLSIAGGGIAFFLYRDGAITSLPVFVLAAVGAILLAVFLFGLFKFLGELAWLMADLGDHQLDVRNVLLDLRDDFDRLLSRSPQSRRTHSASSSRPVESASSASGSESS